MPKDVERYRTRLLAVRSSASLPRLFRLSCCCLAFLLMQAEAGIAEETSPASPEGADWSEINANDWATINKDYAGQRYVNLGQITPDNVGQLKAVCESQLNKPS